MLVVKDYFFMMFCFIDVLCDKKLGIDMRIFGQLLNTIKLRILTYKAYQTSLRKVQLDYLQMFDMFQCDFFNKMTRFTLKNRLRRTPDRRARMADLKYQKARILSEYFSNIAKALHLKFHQVEHMHAENSYIYRRSPMRPYVCMTTTKQVSP